MAAARSTSAPASLMLASVPPANRWVKHRYPAWTALGARQPIAPPSPKT